MRLRATKTSMYKLVSEYAELPPVCETSFEKAYRQPSYYLRWRDVDDMPCKAMLAPCAGRPVLSITRERERAESAYETHALSIADLRQRGMISEDRT